MVKLEQLKNDNKICSNATTTSTEKLQEIEKQLEKLQSQIICNVALRRLSRKNMNMELGSCRFKLIKFSIIKVKKPLQLQTKKTQKHKHQA